MNEETSQPGVGPFTFEYFAEEYCRFRELMGNRKYMIEQPEKLITAFGALVTVYFNTVAGPKEKELRNIMAALKMELGMRQRLIAGLQIQDVLDKI